MFELEGTPERLAETLATCSGNKACQYDLLLTNNEALAMVTLDIDNENQVLQEQVGE